MSLFGSRFVRKDTWLLCYMFVLRHTYLVIALSLSLSLALKPQVHSICVALPLLRL